MDEVRKIEEQKLEEVIKKVKISKEELEDRLDVLGQANLDRLKELREESGDGWDPDFWFFVEQLNQKNATFRLKDKLSRINEFNYMTSEPYFSRIDLYDPKTDKNQTLYIGKFGFTLDKPIVTDWRAKIASVYYRYRYPQKNVEYDTPGGYEIRDLKLKRTFEIDDGKLIKFYNNDIQLDENEIIIDRIENRTGGVLEDIVETIQESQLDIIEADPRQICVVQGCVGSGKSTVAIHKLAHIFFNYPSIIKPQNSILIAKNQILVGYLSTLFPKLGIFDINYKTLRELLIHIIFREKIKIDVDLDLEEETGDMNMDKISQLQEKVMEIHEIVKFRINDLFSQDSNAVFAGFKYSKKYTPTENINEIIKDLEEELISQKDQLKDHRDSPQAWVWKENIAILRKLVKSLVSLRKDAYEKLLKEALETFDINYKEKLSYHDTLIYLYFYFELVGLSNYKKFEYCVVDEGQDFSPLEYLLLSKVVLRGRFAIFGDLNQSLEADGIENWELLEEVVSEAGKAHTFELTTNYRSTKPIIDLARKILKPYTNDYLPNSINRKGEDPKIDNYETNEALKENFTREFTQDLSNLNKSIGVVCYSDEYFDLAQDLLEKSNLPQDKKIILKASEKIEYEPKAVYLMKSEDCKGLEFAKVYILGLNLDRLDNFADSRQAFVALTRAMNEVTVKGIK